MIYAVYVSDKPHSRINFPIGMNNGIWGVHDKKAKTVAGIQPNDYVVFVYAISWLKAEGPPPPGYSRISKDKSDLFRGLVQKINIGRVTRGYYESKTKVWPDDIYPHRFEFDLLEKNENGVLFGNEFYNSALVEAVRHSACTQGAVTRVEEISSLDELYSVERGQTQDPLPSGYVVEEGRPIYKVHKSRERDPSLIKAKKAQVLNQSGKLACEVCEFDFKKAYGQRGDGFIECHHKDPLSLRDDAETTSLDDLALLCSNCHRMIHRGQPWLTIEELQGLYESR